MLFLGTAIKSMIITDADDTLTEINDSVHVFLEQILADTEPIS